MRVVPQRFRHRWDVDPTRLTELRETRVTKRRVSTVRPGEEKKREERGNVLPTVANTGTAHTETREPGAVANPRHVHGTLSDRILPGTQTVHHLQSRVPRCRLPYLLQRHW